MASLLGITGIDTASRFRPSVNAANNRSNLFRSAQAATGFNQSFTPTSILGAFQTSSQQGQAQALSQQLGGINQAVQQARQGFNQGSQFIRQGTQGALSQLQGGLNRGLNRLDTGLQNSLGRIDSGLNAGLDRLDQGLEGARAALAPLRETTIGALGRFSDLTGISGRSINLASDPAFNFRFEQGQRAVQAAQAAGGIGGGRAAKELTEFGQGLAAEELTSQSNRLLNLIGIGAGALGQEASIEASTAAQAANLQQAAASQSAGLTSNTASQAAGLETERSAQAASLLANQGLGLAGLRSQLTQSLADSELARAQARSQSTLQNNSVLRLLQQRGNLISTRNISL